MRRQLATVIFIVAAVAAIGLLGLARSQAQRASSGGLPGARPAVEAIQYASLQAAIDALPESGGVVRLPAGKFEIAQPLVIEKEDVLFIGEGTATHIANTNTAGQPAIVIRHKDYATNKKAHLWRIKLEDFRLTGNEKSGPGIEAQGIDEIFIEGVTVSYHGGDGVRLDHCYEDPRICDSLFTYNKQYGVRLIGCHDIVVASNHFEENQDALLCTDGFNLCMTGNNLDDHLRHGVVIENTYGSVVSGNMIEECQGVGIILDRDCYGITLSANVIAHEVAGGIELRDAHGCTVSGNSFPIVWKNALVVGPESANNTIVGNTFSDTYVGSGKSIRPKDKEFASGITLLGASDVVISGNTFAGLSTKALSLDGETSRRIVFTSNVLRGVESDHGKLTESVVSGNIESR